MNLKKSYQNIFNRIAQVGFVYEINRIRENEAALYHFSLMHIAHAQLLLYWLELKNNNLIVTNILDINKSSSFKLAYVS